MEQDLVLQLGLMAAAGWKILPYAAVVGGIILWAEKKGW